MSGSDAQSARLHQMLDEIIRAKAELKAGDSKRHTPNERPELSGRARDIYAEAANLLAELIDDDVSEFAFGAYPEIYDPDRIRWKAIGIFVEKLSYFHQVLGSPNWSWWVDNLSMELTLLESGDEPYLLSPAPRKPGQGKRPGRIALLRTQALQWLEYMRSHGIKRTERNDLVSKAFGADPETIRQWRKSSAKVLNEDTVRRRIEATTRRGWAPDSYLTIDENGKPSLSESGKQALRENGETYRELFREDRSGNS